jgi:hypothetical protein
MSNNIVELNTGTSVKSRLDEVQALEARATNKIDVVILKASPYIGKESKAKKSYQVLVAKKETENRYPPIQKALSDLWIYVPIKFSDSIASIVWKGGIENSVGIMEVPEFIIENAINNQIRRAKEQGTTSKEETFQD